MISANKTLRRTSWSLKWVVAVPLLLMVSGFGLAESSQNNWDNLKQLRPGQKIEVVDSSMKTLRGAFARNPWCVPTSRASASGTLRTASATCCWDRAFWAELP